jgi:hypothetical protein
MKVVPMENALTLLKTYTHKRNHLHELIVCREREDSVALIQHAPTVLTAVLQEIANVPGESSRSECPGPGETFGEMRWRGSRQQAARHGAR